MESAAGNIHIIPFTPSAGMPARSDLAAGRQKVGTNLRDFSKLLSALWEGSVEGIRLTDEYGIIVSANPAYCRLVGASPDELIGKHFSCVYSPVENRDKMTRTYETHFKKHQAEPKHEQSYVLRTDRILHVEVYDSFIESDDGRTFLLTRFRDVTAEKITQKTLAESESKYRGLFANSVMPMFQSSIDGKLLNANHALLKLLGYKDFYELANLEIARDTYAFPDERANVTAMLHQKGYIVNLEIRLKRKNGRIITVLESARTLLDASGKVIGYEGILEDITARKAMEKKLQEYVSALEKSKNALADLNAQKDKLFSILSHDMRSPFSSILGFCEILLKEHQQLSEEERQQFTGYIQDAAQDQLSLLNRLLDWSRLESGHIRMERAEIDLQDVLQKSVHSLLGIAHQKQITLTANIPALTMVRGDRQMLGQVFANLIGNSLKFTPPNGTITVELSEAANDHWTIGVRDTGVGIPAEDIHKLFKVEEKYTRKGLQGEKGTGLGLPVVHEILLKHQGTIDVQSTRGEGTLFLVTLPRIHPNTGGTILTIDNEQATRVLYSRYIKRVLPEANVLHATDTAEAFHLSRECHPRLVIFDGDSPDINGKEFLRRLKTDPLTQDTPVLMITAHDSNANHELLKRYSAITILHRPLTQDQFSEVLHAIASEKHAVTS
jgi:PAS domain S-box-containing protein